MPGSRGRSHCSLWWPMAAACQLRGKRCYGTAMRGCCVCRHSSMAWLRHKPAVGAGWTSLRRSWSTWPRCTRTSDNHQLLTLARQARPRPAAARSRAPGSSGVRSRSARSRSPAGPRPGPRAAAPSRFRTRPRRLRPGACASTAAGAPRRSPWTGGSPRWRRSSPRAAGAHPRRLPCRSRRLARGTRRTCLGSPRQGRWMPMLQPAATVGSCRARRSLCMTSAQRSLKWQTR
mmetsp:Transcript_10990/g.34333  ORF Transcript_10990/g.34333 Transcript_10990/m.34333 type:complete len:232 (+) Transcript_10990:517-1212(+)